MHITFLAYRVRRDRLETTEFYRQDIEILRSLGYDVTIATKLSEVPRHTSLAFVWWWTWLWLVGPVLKRRNIPIVATGALEPEIYDRQAWYKKLLIRQGLKYVDKPVFVSRYMIRELEKRVTLQDPLYSPHIVMDEYCLDDPQNERREGNVIFNVAWKNLPNMRRKMVPELVEAFALVKKEVPDARLVLAGEPMNGQILLEERVAELGLTDSVEFPGKVSKERKIELMRNCGAYYQCSRHEGFGVAIAEAMACGAPVVVNRRTAIPEVVGDAGYYVRDESIESIAESLIGVLRDPEGARKMGLQAAQRIDDTFRFEVRREFFRELLGEMIGYPSGAKTSEPQQSRRAA